MKVIVEHDEKVSSYLGQYGVNIEELNKFHTILDIEEKYLPWLRELVQHVEPNFEIRLGDKQQQVDEFLFNHSNAIVAVIGTKLQEDQIDSSYNIQTGSIQQTFKRHNPKLGEIISCYSETGIIDAAAYIRCVYYLSNLAKERHKPITLYADVEGCGEKNIGDTLTYKIINEYLSSFQKYQKTEKTGISNRLDRQTGTLYDDVFYQSISLDEEIYILVLTEDPIDEGYYETLGIQYIRLLSNYSLLYARKSQFEAISDILRPRLAPEYRWNILTYPPCQQDQVNPGLTYYPPVQNLRYRGRGVYIGVVAADDVDYTNEALRTLEGTTRIAYLWEQISGDIGQEYLEEQINNALISPTPEEIIKLPEEETTSTMMLAIAGGRDLAGVYRGIASEAEFVIAKVRTASPELQRIYGGMPSKTGIFQPDALIGMIKLIDFATQQGRPIVLIMPFNGNLDAHDAFMPIQQMIALLARRPNVTVIIPVGDEADKRHHYNIEGEQQGLRRIALSVPMPNQNIVGVIYTLFMNLATVNLYPPADISGDPINIKIPGVTRFGETTIYSTGEEISFLNGNKQIVFRIENPGIGEWQIEVFLEMGIISRLDIWISQQALNPYITLNPFSTFNTIGSSAIINGAMSVAAYDQNTMTIVRSSGRGTADNRIIPTLATYGSNVVGTCIRGRWGGVTGTLPAASLMGGVTAALYSKFIDEGLEPLPNTLVINNIIISSLRQFDTIQYPNPNQGYGVFATQSLTELLAP